jgi:hypothetical protein
MFSIHKGYCLEAIERATDQWIVRITRLDGKNITASRHSTSPSWDTPAATLPDYAMRLAKAAIDTGRWRLLNPCANSKRETEAPRRTVR